MSKLQDPQEKQEHPALKNWAILWKPKIQNPKIKGQIFCTDFIAQTSQSQKIQYVEVEFSDKFLKKKKKPNFQIQKHCQTKSM